MEKNPIFWRSKEDILKKLIDEVSVQIDEFDKFAAKELSFTRDEALSYKAIWCVGGAGSYEKPLIDAASDQKFGDRPGYSGTDKERLDHTAKVIYQLAKTVSGKLSISKEGQTDIIEKFGPTLIYNGVEEQDESLLRNAGNHYPVPKDKIYIPDGEIVRTIDQVRGFSLPDDTRINEGDKIGIVSHSTHLPRIVRMMGKYPTVFENINITLFPVKHRDQIGILASRELEIAGIIDYIARDEATFESFHYSLIG